MEDNHGDNSNSVGHSLGDDGMNTVMIRTVVRMECLLVLLACLVGLGTTQPAWAAEQSFIGTIQDLPPSEDNFVIISGRQWVLNTGDTQVFLNGRRIDESFISVGMVVRCTVDARGVIQRMEILGPVDKVRELTNN